MIQPLFPPRPRYHSDRDPATFPRWLNLDDHLVKDTWSGWWLTLTCKGGWDAQACSAHATQVTDALNRIYHG